MIGQANYIHTFTSATCYWVLLDSGYLYCNFYSIYIWTTLDEFVFPGGGWGGGGLPLSVIGCWHIDLLKSCLKILEKEIACFGEAVVQGVAGHPLVDSCKELSKTITNLYRVRKVRGRR